MGKITKDPTPATTIVLDPALMALVERAVKALEQTALAAELGAVAVDTGGCSGVRFSDRFTEAFGDATHRSTER